MPDYTARSYFILPSGKSLEEQVDFCLSVINRYRLELPLLRRQNDHLQKQQENREKEIVFWKEKYQQEKDRVKKKEEEISKLKVEIERLTKTNQRYQVALFDHGNFKSPQEENKKEKGGQIGHEDTNREKNQDYTLFPRKRLFLKTCVFCHHPLKRVSSVKQKILLDIVLNPRVVKMVLESERQWCPQCQKEVNAKDTRSLPFTEYGLNAFLVVLILRFKCHLSLFNISQAITISHGLSLSKSDVASILLQAKVYLRGRYESLIALVRKNEVLYSDETGWLVKGQSAWLWIMASDNTTVYFAAESRGGGIAQEMYGESQAYTMHDGFASYTKSAPLAKQCYCWAHFLRFCFEETVNQKKNSLAVNLRDQLVEIYHLKSQRTDLNPRQLKDLLTQNLNVLLRISSTHSAIISIQKRLRVQKEGLVNSLLFTPNGTNNLAEQELRPMVLNKKISFGSDTFEGLETSAILGSIIQTWGRQKDRSLSQLRLYFQEGVKQKYPQYAPVGYFDSS